MRGLRTLIGVVTLAVVLLVGMLLVKDSPLGITIYTPFAGAVAALGAVLAGREASRGWAKEPNKEP